MKKTLPCAVDTWRTVKNVCRAPRSQNARQSQIGPDGLPDRPGPPFKLLRIYKLPPIPTNPTQLPPASQPRHPPPSLPDAGGSFLSLLGDGGSLLSLPLSPASPPRRSDARWWPPPQVRRKIRRQWRPDGVPGSARWLPLPDHGAAQDPASPPPGGPHAVALRSRGPVPFRPLPPAWWQPNPARGGRIRRPTPLRPARGGRIRSPLPWWLTR
jgi:hypothetical protein